MKISKFRKYITWNIISCIGYVGLVWSVIFLVMLMLTSSGLSIRFDVSQYFYEYMTKRVLLPYLKFYKIQLLLIGILSIASVYENSYYISKQEYGLRLFYSHEDNYIFFFVTGLGLNFLPMYVLLPILVKWYANLFF